MALTLAAPFPRVLVSRRVTIPGARYFGPYTDVATLRQTLKIIRRIFTVRSCHWDLPREAPDRPCLDYHIERCRAPCVALQSAADYARCGNRDTAGPGLRAVDLRDRKSTRLNSRHI